MSVPSGRGFILYLTFLSSVIGMGTLKSGKDGEFFIKFFEIILFY